MPIQYQNSTLRSKRTSTGDIWLRRHADYQRVYKEGKRQSLSLMTYFFAARKSADATVADLKDSSPRVGLTAGRVLGNAVARNRIKRRMRAAVRLHYGQLVLGMDIVLHPRRTVLEAPFSEVERDVAKAFQAAHAVISAAAGAAVSQP